jgi:uridine phosphorylase
MRDENINHAFLDAVVAGQAPDIYYHFGVSSADRVLEEFRDVRAIVLAGPGGRIVEFASRWSHDRGGAAILALAKEDRFVTRYCDGVLFASHGMGSPSAAIAVQELMRMLFFLKDGDLDAMSEVFWTRVGTSGGIQVDPGTVVVTSEGVMADLKPYRLLKGAEGTYWFDGSYPTDVANAILASNDGSGIPMAVGRTVAGNDFFLEQYRLDGAIRLESNEAKMAWLEWIEAEGVRNIEMEGAMFAGFLNHWGFPNFAMMCVTIVNRLEGDQITATSAELEAFRERLGSALFNHLHAILG